MVVVGRGGLEVEMVNGVVTRSSDRRLGSREFIQFDEFLKLFYSLMCTGDIYLSRVIGRRGCFFSMILFTRNVSPAILYNSTSDFPPNISLPRIPRTLSLNT